MKLKLPAILEPLLTKKKRFKIIIGGRGSGKSTGVANVFLLKSAMEQSKIGCFREFQNSIDDSVYSLICSEIESHELISDYTVTNNNIKSNKGGSFTFKGLARNPHSIKSMDGYKYFWVEEAQAISETSLKLLTPTLREKDSELWFTANPQSSADAFSQRFINPFKDELDKNGFYEDDLHMIVVCNYMDNPWFPEELELERQWDEDNLSRALYRHIWLGDFYDEVKDSIISVDWFDAAIDAHIKLGFKGVGAKIATHDPSDLGHDAKGYCLRHGSIIKDIRDNKTGDVNEGCDWALDLAINANADIFVYDSDGLGASLRRQITTALNGKPIETIAFHGGGTVEQPKATYQPVERESKSKRSNKDTFKNKRAQYYWKLRDRFYNTYRAVVHGEYCDPAEMISLSSNIADMNQLRAEVCRIPRIPNGQGLIQIMSKDKMGKEGIKSPNMADALMMSMLTPPHTNANTSPIDFSSPFR